MIAWRRIPADSYRLAAEQCLEACQGATRRKADRGYLRNGAQRGAAVIAYLIGELRGISSKPFFGCKHELPVLVEVDASVRRLRQQIGRHRFVVAIVIIGEYIAVGCMAGRSGEFVTQCHGGGIAGRSIMRGGADGQFVDGYLLAAADTLVINV